MREQNKIGTTLFAAPSPGIFLWYFKVRSCRQSVIQWASDSRFCLRFIWLIRVQSTALNVRHKPQWRRLIDVWLDGVEQGWAVPIFLVGFVAIWMAYLGIAYQSGDLHPDVLEAWTLGREFSWGDVKHPPLMGWMAGVWSVLFPPADWSLYLLAMVNSALALWIVDLISRKFLSGDKRAVVLLLLMLLPAYQFHAQRFNANTVLLATWPLAVYCFLNSFETRKFYWAIAAGAAAALAMLGKYYSIFLIVSFALAALAHPDRRKYFLSSAPWISALAGLAVLAPHLWFLTTTTPDSLSYPLLAHGGQSLEIAAKEAIQFVAGNLAYLVIPCVAWSLMIRFRLRTYVSRIFPLESNLLLLLLIFAGTLFIPPVTTALLQTDLPPIWNMQALFIPVVIFVAAAKFAIDRFDCENLFAAVLAFLALAVAIAPLHALYRNTHAYDFNRNFLRVAADEITRQWHQTSNEPFVIVTGDDSLAFATAFYSPDHPFYRRTSVVAAAHSQFVGYDRSWAGMCFSTDAPCMSWMSHLEKTLVSSVRSEFVLQTRLWGYPGLTTNVSTIISLSNPIPAVPASTDDEEFSAVRRKRPTVPH